MVYITAVHMAGGTGHEYISSVRWQDPAARKTEESTTAEMVRWIDGGGVAKVHGHNGDVHVGTVNTTPKHLRTYANGQWTDNLLSLPRF